MIHNILNEEHEHFMKMENVAVFIYTVKPLFKYLTHSSCNTYNT